MALLSCLKVWLPDAVVGEEQRGTAAEHDHCSKQAGASHRAFRQLWQFCSDFSGTAHPLVGRLIYLLGGDHTDPVNSLNGSTG